MEQHRWTGLSTLYVCPLKALLNNLLPRLESYPAWLGRRVAIWHSMSPRRPGTVIAPDLPAEVVDYVGSG